MHKRGSCWEAPSIFSSTEDFCINRYVLGRADKTHATSLSIFLKENHLQALSQCLEGCAGLNLLEGAVMLGMVWITCAKPEKQQNHHALNAHWKDFVLVRFLLIVLVGGGMFEFGNSYTKCTRGQNLLSGLPLEMLPNTHLEPFLVSPGDDGHILLLYMYISGIYTCILPTGKTRAPAQYSAESQLQSTACGCDTN